MTHQSFESTIKPFREVDKKPILFIGNGFSIDWSPNVFRYQAILDQADETEAFAVASEFARTVFEKLNTNDFEAVAKALATASGISEHYQSNDRVTVERMKEDIGHVQNILVDTIARHHPANSLAVTDAQYEACRDFLINFGSIYTINYDLLLYWVINKHLEELKFEDRFEDPVTSTLEDGEEYYEEDYVRWSLGNEAKASLFYLHGALHLYDAGYEVRKYSQRRTGINLKDQILGSLNNGLYPLFVSGGDSLEKMEKISHSGYLSRCYRSLQGANGTAFAFGMSFKSNDDHILQAIAQSTISKLYVSVRGDIDDGQHDDLKNAMERLKTLRENRIRNSRKRINIDIEYFDAPSADIWGNRRAAENQQAVV